MNNLPPAIFLMGPTASGKTGVAVELMQALPVEIISVDSALVYRGMDIGTAKPDATTLARAPHHLIDIIDPTSSYSAAAFRRDALRLMADITQRGKIPLLVGGTMLYFKALREGLSPLPQADAAVRTALDADIAQHGIEWLHARLAEVDAVTAARLHTTDTQRIQRAMEIFRITGRPMSELIKKTPSPQPLSQWARGYSATLPLPAGQAATCQLAGLVDCLVAPSEGWGEGELPYRLLPIALIPSDRAALHQCIATRFKQMLQQGLVEELRGLQAQYALHPELPSMRCVGYRQAWEFLAGRLSESELLEHGIIATRQLAKRQMTWLRGMTDNIAFDCFDPQLTGHILASIQTHLSPLRSAP